MTITATPGLKTVSERDYAQCAKRRAAGYEWVSFQAYNRGKRDYDLSPAKSAGLEAGVWGVLYSAENFYVEACALAQQAVKLKAAHYIVDIEMAAKNTRADRGLQPVISGARDGGWTREIHLNTLGPAAGDNDYEMDLQSILDTGGGVFTQAYANENDTYTPELAVKYWTRVGVPIDQLNLTISLFPAEQDKQYPGRRYDGAKWVELLNASGHTNKRALSIFMDEALLDEDLEALKVLTLLQPPRPPSPITDNRNSALGYLSSSVAYWRNTGLTEDALQRQRQTLAWRSLNMPQTKVAQDTVRAALDQAGAPNP